MSEKWKLTERLGIVLALLLFMAVPPNGEAQEVSTNCAAEVSFEMETGKAQITSFSCYIKPFENKEVLWYEFQLKNISDAPARFVIRIIPDEGPAFSGLIPRVGKPKNFPVLGPGEALTDKYAMNTMTQAPGSLVVVVEEDVQ